MHIKQVSISGFRSFRQQPEIESFSARHNVIVGRNGSGKSNFFDAIQFALLNQRFSSLRQEERQVLLHEGAGSPVLSAFVEIVFDNSDGRLAQDGDEVVLRRTIGLKKDEFFLNRKRVTKQEVSSLLESAGFSKANPYYIVQQGKVSTLTLMKDAERLNLLKEVAGTKVYEERRQESLKIMDELKNKFEKIQEVISFIEERLGELEEEKEELGAYQKHDKQRRALEYALYDKELTKARESLQDKDRAMEETEDRIRDLQERLHESRSRAGHDETGLAEEEAVLSRLEKQVAAKEAERRELLGARAKLELEVKDLSERVVMDGDEQERLGEELKTLDRNIDARRKDLETEAGPAYEKAKASVTATEAELAAATGRREDLYAKQSRGSKYRTVAERDAALKSQVKSIRKAAQGKLDTATSLRAQADEAVDQLERQRKRAAEMEEQLQQRHAQSQRISAELVQKTAARNNLAEERKERWRVLESLQDRIEEQKAALEKSERDLKFAMPRNVASGLDAVERLVKEQRIEGYYGPVYENFALRDPILATAVEVAGGNSIFNVIVDTDDTAAKLMHLLERRKLGRVTFMPLNTLARRMSPRKDLKEKVVAYLIEAAIKFRPEVKPAMEQIFGKKLLAKDLETASKYSERKDCDMDVVTMNGDEFNRKGSISGGYHDERAARLLTLERIRGLAKDLDGLTAKRKDMQTKANEADQAVSNVMGEVQKLETKRANNRNVMAQTNKELSHVKKAAVTTEEQLQEKRELLEQVRREAEEESTRADALDAEIGTPLLATLTDDDQRTLHELNTVRVPALNARLKAEFDALEIAAAARTRLLSILNGNLKRRREEVRELLDPDRGGIGGSARSGEAEERLETLAQRREELSKVERSLGALRTEVEDIESEASERKQKVSAIRKEADKAKAEEAGLLERLAEEAKIKAKLKGKQEMCVTQLEDNSQKMQNLGTLPHDEHEQYKTMDTKRLMKKLNAANESLKKFSHVNKKALDQYVSFSEQRETILKRKNEIDAAQTAIKELIEGLDLQKDEAILRTFRGVSQNFSEVFQELVPAGSGQMIIKTSADAADTTAASKKRTKNPEEDEEVDAEDDDDEGNGEGGRPGSGKKKKGKGKGKARARQEDDDGEEAGSGAESNGLTPTTLVSDFVGVQIKVSFVAAGETFLMSQLSGGQKAVVALALIFAIQRCDPAPFYLFDEIDQALDSSYRAAVASLIQRQAHSSENPTQFITTTFRPEMVAVASQCYGISHQNKVSNIHVLPREEALGFVANIMNEEEAVGVELQQPVSAAGPTGRRARGAGEEADEMDVDEEDEEADEEVEDEEQEEQDEKGDGGDTRTSVEGKRRKVRRGEQRASSSR